MKKIILLTGTRADFGKGNSTELFLECLQEPDVRELNHQKQFRDRV